MSEVHLQSRVPWGKGVVLGARFHLRAGLVFQPTIMLEAGFSPSAVEESRCQSHQGGLPICHVTNSGASALTISGLSVPRPPAPPLPLLVVEETEAEGKERFSQKEPQRIVGQLA